MALTINFHIVPIQFDYILTDIRGHLLRDVSNEVTLLWLGIAAAVFVFLVLLRFQLRRTLDPASRIPVFFSAFSPFLLMFVTLFPHTGDPENSIITLIHSLFSFWLAIALLRMPLKLLDYFDRKLFYISSAFFAVSGAILLFKQLSLIASFTFYSDAVSLFALLETISKFGIVTGMYLYGHMLLPPLLARWPHLLPSWFSVSAFKILIRTFFIVFAILWVGDYLSISLKALMLLFLWSAFAGLFVMIRHHTVPFVRTIYDATHYTPLELDSLSYHLQKSALLLLVFFFYRLTPYFTELQRFDEMLKQSVLIRTSLLELSLFQLVSAVFAFNLLHSILVLLAKRLRLVGALRESINAKSIEALALNIGLLVILIIALIQMDISWHVFIPIAGALGIGFGFGLQTILNNYMSGFIILSAKKMRIGDIVELGGNAGNAVGNTGDTIMGTVEAIDILSTTLKTADGIEVSIPNSFFISEKIVNYSQTTPFVRVKITVGVDYATDLEVAEQLIIEALNDCDMIEQNMEKGVMFTQFGSSSLDLMPYFWVNIRTVKALGPLKGDIMNEILKKFRANGISIPFPRSDVTILNPISITNA